MRKQALLMAVPALILGVGLTVALVSTAQAQAKTPKPPTLPVPASKWEYRDFHGTGNHDEDYKGLDELGAQGWEAYAYTQNNGDDWELKRRR